MQIFKAYIYYYITFKVQNMREYHTKAVVTELNPRFKHRSNAAQTNSGHFCFVVCIHAGGKSVLISVQIIEANCSIQIQIYLTTNL